MDNKILIVEANKETGLILKLAFRDSGYHVDLATTESVAIDLGKTNDYFAALIDIKIPGVDGFKICQEIKKTHKKCKTIAMTGYDAIYGCEKCVMAGFNNYFPKPYDPDDLIRVSRDAIVRHSIW
ncbi:MAG TPA: response regulator [bacterium]|nr:response regulator [bacterium]HPN43209.1 response regulator [bacterium]